MPRRTEQGSNQNRTPEIDASVPLLGEIRARVGNYTVLTQQFLLDENPRKRSTQPMLKRDARGQFVSTKIDQSGNISDSGENISTVPQLPAVLPNEKVHFTDDTSHEGAIRNIDPKLSAVSYNERLKEANEQSQRFNSRKPEQGKTPSAFEQQILDQLRGIKEQNEQLIEKVNTLQTDLNNEKIKNAGLLKMLQGKQDQLTPEEKTLIGDVLPPTPTKIDLLPPADKKDGSTPPTPPATPTPQHVDVKERRGFLRNGVNPAVVTAASIAVGGKVARTALQSVPFIGAGVAGVTSLVGTVIRRQRGIRGANGERLRDVTTMDELERYSHIDSKNIAIRIFQGYTKLAERNLVLMRAAGVTSDAADRMEDLQRDTGATVGSIQQQTNPDGSTVTRMTSVPQIDLDAFTNMSRTEQLELLGDAYRHIDAVDTALSRNIGLSANQRKTAQKSRDQAEEFAQMYLGVMYSEDGRPPITDAYVRNTIAQREDQLEARGRTGAMLGMAGLAAAKTLLFTELGSLVVGIAEDIGNHIHQPSIKPITQPANDIETVTFGAKGNPAGFPDKFAPHGINTKFANLKQGDFRGQVETQIALEHGIGTINNNPASTRYGELVFNPYDATQAAALHQIETQNPGLVNAQVIDFLHQAKQIHPGVKQLGQVRLEHIYDIQNPTTKAVTYDATMDFSNGGHVQTLHHIAANGTQVNAHAYATMQYKDQLENPQLHPEFWRGQLNQLLQGNSKQFAQLRDVYANALQNNPNIIPTPLKNLLLQAQKQGLFENYFNVDGTLKVDVDKIPPVDARQIVQLLNRLRVNPVLKNIA